MKILPQAVEGLSPMQTPHDPFERFDPLFT
jgi:hypothetical protein